MSDKKRKKNNNNGKRKKAENTHLLEEWKQVNEYINKIEVDHTAKFAIFLSGIIVSLATLSNFFNIGNSSNMYNAFTIGVENHINPLNNAQTADIHPASFIFAIIPIAAIGMLAYTIYQFKLNEIARGYLCFLEEKINKKIGYVHFRHKELYKFSTYGRKFMPVIIFVALFALEFFCVIYSKYALNGWSYECKVIYWACVAGLVFILFLCYWVKREKLQENISKYFKEKKPNQMDKIDYKKDYKAWLVKNSGNDNCCDKTWLIVILDLIANGGVILVAVLL